AVVSAGRGRYRVETRTGSLSPKKAGRRDRDERKRGNLHRRRRLLLALPPLRAARRRAGPYRLCARHSEPRRLVRALLSLSRRLGLLRLLPRPPRLGPERTGPRRCVELPPAARRHCGVPEMVTRAGGPDEDVPPRRVLGREAGGSAAAASSGAGRWPGPALPRLLLARAAGAEGAPAHPVGVADRAAAPLPHPAPRSPTAHRHPALAP